MGNWFRKESWSLQDVPAPWGDRKSIYEHLKARAGKGSRGLVDGVEDLPDESKHERPKGIRWAAGALDGVMGHHTGSGDASPADEVFDALLAVLKKADGKTLGGLYGALTRSSALQYIDAFQEKLMDDPEIDRDRLHRLAQWLEKGAADREAVKIAIALLGMVATADDIEIFLILGRHDEFTLFCAVAITASVDPPDATLWELAKHVEGWGRIQVVERLAKTQDPRIRRWMLRSGFRNSIMHEYLAHTCAVAGDLRQELDADRIDDELLSGACDLLRALIGGRGGPAAGIDDYDDGAAVTERFLHHLKLRASRLAEYLAVLDLRKYLEEEDADWKDRESKGWTEEFRAQLLKDSVLLLGRPLWRDLALRGLVSSDPVEFGDASSAAKSLGIDAWEHHFRRFQEGDGYSSWCVVQTDRADQFDQVIDVLERTLPFGEIETGPAEELGLGAEFAAHQRLGTVLQELGRFPGKGWRLLRAGFRSPVVRDRSMALRALQAWPRSAWPADAEALLRRAAAEEPDARVREDLTKALS